MGRGLGGALISEQHNMIECARSLGEAALLGALGGVPNVGSSWLGKGVVSDASKVTFLSPHAVLCNVIKPDFLLFITNSSATATVHSKLALVVARCLERYIVQDIGVRDYYTDIHTETFSLKPRIHLI